MLVRVLRLKTLPGTARCGLVGIFWVLAPALKIIGRGRAGARLRRRAVRRLQAVRLGPRDGPPGPRGLHRSQGRHHPAVNQQPQPGAGPAGPVPGLLTAARSVAMAARRSTQARAARHYSPAASATSATCAVSGLQGKRISSSQPASVKAATASATFCGEVRAPAAIWSAKSPMKL